MTRPYVIWPLRFSPNAPAMIDFYSRIGLHLTFSHDNGTFATFRGRAGTLGVHDARDTTSGKVTGHTALNLATNDTELAVAELAASGYDVKIWDETYGKQGIVMSRDGRVIGINGDSQEDLYGGYQTHDEAAAAPVLDVVAVCITSEMKAEAVWFEPLGFTAPSYDDPHWIGLRAGDRFGVLGIHPGEVESSDPRDADDLFGPPYLVGIGFETSEPLAVFADRLSSAGLDPTMITDGSDPRVVPVDPDGEEVQIHPAP